MNRTAYFSDKKRLLALLVAAMLLLASVATAEDAVHASITGCAFVDTNGDMVCDEGEVLMSGLTARLYRYVDEEWQEMAAAETDEYGLYTFAIAEEGEYCIRSSIRHHSFFHSTYSNLQKQVLILLNKNPRFFSRYRRLLEKYSRFCR